MISRRSLLQTGGYLGVAAVVPSVIVPVHADMSVTIAESEGHGWAVVYTADAADLWANNGLEAGVAKFTAGRLALDAVLTESAEFCTTTQSPTLLALMRGLEPRVVADFSRSSREMLVAANRTMGVSEPSDLKGKKIATKVGTSGHFFLNQWLALHGMALSDVELVNMGGPEMVTAVVRGDVDAFAWDWLTAIAAQEQAGEDIVVLDREGIEEIWAYHLIFVANSSLVEESPETVEKAVQSLLDAEELINTDRSQAIGHVAERTATSIDDTTIGMDLLDIGVTLDDSLVDVMVAEAEWAIGQGISPEYDGDLRALFRGAVYEDALQKLAPERVNLSG